MAGHTIMIVEDNQEIREALMEVLDEEGYQSIGVAHGEEALAQLRAGTYPHLILLDLMMPVMDGWQFRAEQQRDPALARIPVVVLTADGAAEAKARQLGATGHLHKPVHIEQLLATITRYCP